jgi:hypothetical protein
MLMAKIYGKCIRLRSKDNIWGKYLRIYFKDKA